MLNCFGYIPECEGSISAPSFDRQPLVTGDSSPNRSKMISLKTRNLVKHKIEILLLTGADSCLRWANCPNIKTWNRKVCLSRNRSNEAR